MTKTTDPFTRTPGLAGKAYIDDHISGTIIDAFNDPDSQKHVFKIVGLRGSGKSVAYGTVINQMKGNDNWLVYTLSAAGEPVDTLIAKMSADSILEKKRKSTTVGASAQVSGSLPLINGGASFSISQTSSDNDHYYSPEAILEKMIDAANAKGKNVLIGVDDISRTDGMVKLLSIAGRLILEGKQLYLLCTGLSGNIEDFSGEPSLTFFRRSDSVETRALDRYDICCMYQNLLGLEQSESARLAKFVKGYAYAYQVLGTLIFNKKPYDGFDSILPQFDRIMSQDSYDLIWKSLTAAEKELVKVVVNSSGRVSEIKMKMSSPKSYGSLRDRLIKKHVLKSDERGELEVALPRFKEFVELWEL